MQSLWVLGFADSTHLSSFLYWEQSKKLDITHCLSISTQEQGLAFLKETLTFSVVWNSSLAQRFGAREFGGREGCDVSQKDLVVLKCRLQTLHHFSCAKR